MLQGVLGKGDVINLSNDAAIRAYFPKKQFEYSQFVEDNFSDCYKFAVKSKEVLLCWRGCLPLEYLCVIDDVTQANWRNWGGPTRQCLFEIQPKKGIAR